MAICLAHTQHCTIIRCSLARTCCASKFHARVRSCLRVFSFLLWCDRRARRHECSQAGWAWFFDKLGPCLPLRNAERLPPCPCGNPTLRPDYLLNWHHCCRTRSAACACACMRVPSCTLHVVVDASFGWPAPKVTHVPGQFAERFEKLLRTTSAQNIWPRTNITTLRSSAQQFMCVHPLYSPARYALLCCAQRQDTRCAAANVHSAGLFQPGPPHMLKSYHGHVLTNATIRPVWQVLKSSAQTQLEG